MESKLNHQAIDAYSKAFSKKITQSFFNTHSHINGAEILELCAFKQINLILIKNLFVTWKKENAKLRSPYFNYEHEAVKKAMKDFMNTLSKHIHIQKEHFEPLLREAVKDTLLLVFSPYDFFSKEINQREDSQLRLADLHDLSKYIKINDFLLNGLIKQFEKEHKEAVFNEEAFAIFNDVCANSNDEPEDVAKYLAVFSATIPLNSAEIYSEFDESDGREAKKILNEKYSDKANTTLSDQLTKGKYKSLKKQLSLNQRFMFVNELFAGNEQEFKSALEQLESTDTFEQSSDYIHTKLVKKYDWDEESEEVQEFMELIERKFK